MTNEEAKDLLDNLIGMVEDNQNNDYDEALKLGIEALEKQINAEEHDKQALQKFAEYVKREIDKWWYRSELDMSSDNVNSCIDSCLTNYEKESKSK